jgi:hypothetical protein
MSERARTTRPGGLIAIILLAVAILALVFFAVDYALGTALLAGIVIAWLAWRLLVGIVRRRRARREAGVRKRRWWVWLIVALGAVGMLGLVVVVLAILLVAPMAGPFEEIIEEVEAEAQEAVPCPDAIVTGVEIVVLGENIRTGTLEVGGSATAFAPGLDDGYWDVCAREVRSAPFSVPLPAVSVTGAKRGLLLKEVTFYEDDMVVQALRAEGLNRFERDYDSLSVELQDFPRGSFFDARNADDLEAHPYLHSETITWTQRARDPVTFSYVPPAWRFLKPVLAFSYRVGSVGETAVALGGMLGSFVVSAVFESLIGDFAKGRLSKLAKRARRKS